jgi:hypothetical protein
VESALTGPRLQGPNTRPGGQAHGPDPTSAIEHKDRAEAQEAVRIDLRIVEELDSRHYKLLTKSCELTAAAN